MVGAPHDLPGIAVIVDMQSPRQRLEADAQAAARGAFAEFMKIGGGAVDAPERGRLYVAADQQQVGLQLLHHIEFALGAREIAGALRLGHALEIAERLECADLEAEIAAELPDVAWASAERQKVILENLDRVEAGGGDGAQLFVECAAERDGGDRALGHANPSLEGDRR